MSTDRWTRVEDGLPEVTDETWVLTYDVRTDTYGLDLYHPDEAESFGRLNTHWMPVPPPPAE